MKPTTDPDPLSKDCKWVFCSLTGKIGHIKEYEDVHTAGFAPYKSKHNGELTLYGVDAVVNLKQPESTQDVPQGDCGGPRSSNLNLKK